MANKNTEAKVNKKRLGRGLGSLLGVSDNDESTERADSNNSEETQKTASGEAKKVIQEKISDNERIHFLPIEQLKANQQQPRRVFREEALKELTQSIKEKGIMQPIVAQKLGEKSFEIIAGERRWRAAQRASLAKVPVILRDTDAKDSLELALIENIQRDNLNPIEEALAYQVLVEKHKMTQVEVADKVGKERATIANTLRLLKLSKEVQSMVSEGILSMGHARCLVAVSDKELQRKLAKKCIDLSLSVRATEKLIKNALEGKPDLSAEESQENKAVTSLAKEIQTNTGAKTKIKYKNGKGHLELHFHNKEQFEGLIKMFREWNN